MRMREATTNPQATQRPAQPPRTAALVLLACSWVLPAHAVITTVTDSCSTYALSLQVGAPTGVDTVEFNVSGNNVGLTPTAVTGTPTIEISVTPVRPVTSSSTARPVSLRVDSSSGLVCQSGSGCGATIIPFSKISWTVSNSSGAAAGDIQNGIFNNSSSQQIASFNANATYCSGFVFLGACLFGSWYYQSNTMNATRLSFTYANDVIYPAGSYKGTVYFTASME